MDTAEVFKMVLAHLGEGLMAFSVAVVDPPSQSIRAKVIQCGTVRRVPSIRVVGPPTICLPVKLSITCMRCVSTRICADTTATILFLGGHS